MNRGLMILVAALLVWGCGTPPSPSPTPSPDLAWNFLELPNDEGASFASVAATGHDVVIVGGRDMGPVAWASHVGSAWMSEQLPPDSGLPGSLQPLGDGLLAVGGVQTNRCAHPAATVFSVRSAAGRWAVAPFDQLFCAGGASVSVAVAGGRARVVGSGTGDVAFAWSSDDGLTWVDVGFPAQMFPRMLTAMGGGFGALGARDDRWLFGRSDAGPRWTVTPLPLLPFGAEAVGLAELNGGAIAWFARPDGEMFALRSQTGEVWDSVGVQDLSAVTIQRVKRSADGFIALGFVPTGPRLFVSRDGVHWRHVVGPSDGGLATYDDLALSGDRAILLGTVTVGDAGVGLAWGGPASSFKP